MCRLARRVSCGPADEQARRELAAAIARADELTAGHLAVADLGLNSRASTATATLAAWPMPPASDPDLLEDMLAVLHGPPTQMAPGPSS
jgi:hypothetical protein